MTERPVLDCSELPSATFGHRSLPWWGTVGFMMVEGMTLAVAATSYLYLRRNFQEWPPPPTPLPDLLLPTISLLVLLSGIMPMWLAGRRSHEFDASGSRSWLFIAAGVGAVALVLRGFEFGAVNTRWDAHAYGSIVWLILGLHTTLLLIDVLETLAIGLLLGGENRKSKHFADVDDAKLYQYFLSLSWVPLYVLLYLSPRVW